MKLTWLYSVLSRVFDRALCLWLGMVCLASSILVASGVYVATYYETRFEPVLGVFELLIGGLLLLVGLRSVRWSASCATGLLMLPLIGWAILLPGSFCWVPLVLMAAVVLLLVGRKNSLYSRFAPGLATVGVTGFVMLAVVAGWYWFGCHERRLWVVAWLLKTLLRVLHLSADNHGAMLFVDVGRDYRSFWMTVDLIGLFPLLLMVAGTVVLICIAGVNRRKACLRAMVILILYAVIRFLLMVWIYLCWPQALQISLFWNATVSLISWLPLAWVMRLSISLDLQQECCFDGKNCSRSVWRWVTIVVLGGVCLLAGTLLTDPGHQKAGRVLIDEGHSEWEDTQECFDTNWYGRLSTYNYYSMADYLAYYYTVDQKHEPLTDELLGEYDIVILKCPTRTVSHDEMGSIIRFVKRGGGLFLIGDHTDVFGFSTYINPLTQCFGMRFNRDGQWDLYGRYSIYEPGFVAHPVVKHMPPMVFATGCTLQAPVWADKPIIGYGMMRRHPDYSRRNFFPEQGHYEDREFGLFLQIAGVYDGWGRVLCFTDSTIWSNFGIFMRGKAELLLGCMQWLDRSNSWLGRMKFCVFWVGIALLVLSVWLLPHRIRLNEIMCMSFVFLTVFAAALFMIKGVHAVAYPEPKAIKDVPEIVFDCRHSRMFLPNRRYYPEGPDRKTIPQLQSFFLAGQRLGYVPRVSFDLSKAVAGKPNAVVVVNPQSGWVKDELEKLKDYVDGGGSLLILFEADEVDLPSLNQLTDVFGMPASTGGVTNRVNMHFGMDGAFNTNVVYTFAAPLPVSTKDAFFECLQIGENAERIPVISSKSCGEGRVWLCSMGEPFSNKGLGASGGVPSEKQRYLYDMVYRLYDQLMEETP